MARKKFYSAIIPAWNEERTIKDVIKAFQGHSFCREVIVVSDGSTDATAGIARAAGAVVIELKNNLGKGEAMNKGVEKAGSDVVFFSDADILGLNPAIISKIADPVLEGKCAMSIGIVGRSIYWMNHILHFFPLLAGQRVITRDLWYAVPKIYRTRFKIETALNYYSKKLGKTAHFALFSEIRQVKKEMKYGFFRGFWMRIGMFAEFLSVSVRLYVFDRLFTTWGQIFSRLPSPGKAEINF